MSGISARNDGELWRTMSEPDIDPRLADGLRSNRDFAEWWVQQFLPSLELDELVEIKPNFTRERESWPAQSSSGRETDLHIVIKDKSGTRHAILTESKIVAPAGHCQPEDYSAYAEWGEREGKWTIGLTVLMAPADYLARHRSAERYSKTISYEQVCESASAHGLADLAVYLRAGIIRSERAGAAPRNPDDLIGGFRVQYADLLRDESKELHECLRGKDRKLFDGSQRWFYFCPKQSLLGKSGVQIVHKICTRKKGLQDRSQKQKLSVHVPREKNKREGPPNWGATNEWRPSKSYWIRDISIDRDAWLIFEDFDGDSARRVWRLVSELIEYFS